MKLLRGTSIANFKVCVLDYSPTIIHLTQQRGRAEDQVVRN
jgi:hypothetical protein